MQRLGDVLRGAYELAGLLGGRERGASTARSAGTRWDGPTFVLGPSGRHTPDEDATTYCCRSAPSSTEAGTSSATGATVTTVSRGLTWHSRYDGDDGE
jgi:hypothetical protein